MMVDPKTLATAPPFSDLFPIRPINRSPILESMKRSGYSQGQPIIVWKERQVILDGHTRRDCAIEAGVRVTVFEQPFPDEDTALEFAIKAQTDRRELTEPERAKCIRLLDERKQAGRPNKLASIEANLCPATKPESSRKSAEKTAELVGSSRVVVERARQVIRESPDLYEKVEAGEISSITRAYDESQARRGKGRLVAREATRSSKATPKPDASFARPLPPARTEPTAEHFITGDVSPLRATLVNTQGFDIDAAIYLKFKDRIDALDRDVHEFVGACSLAWMSPLRKLIHDLANLPHPKDWVICPQCNGKPISSKDGSTCKRCNGSCFQFPNPKG